MTEANKGDWRDTWDDILRLGSDDIEEELRVFVEEQIAKARIEGETIGFERAVDKYDSVVAEFGDQGLKIVGSILDEWFHSQGPEPIGF